MPERGEMCRNTSYPVQMAFQGISEAPTDPLFERYLSVYSSQHLAIHYASVWDSLTPVQRVCRRLSEGAGRWCLVALALAMLFDVLATQAKGQTAPLHNYTSEILAQAQATGHRVNDTELAWGQDNRLYPFIQIGE